LTFAVFEMLKDRGREKHLFAAFRFSQKHPGKFKGNLLIAD